MSTYLSLLFLAAGVVALAAWMTDRSHLLDDAVDEALTTPLTHWDGLVPCQFPGCPARVVEPRDGWPLCAGHRPVFDQAAS